MFIFLSRKLFIIQDNRLILYNQFIVFRDTVIFRQTIYNQLMIKQQQIRDQAVQLQQQQEEKEVIDSLTSSLNSHDEFHTLLLKELKDMKGTIKEKKKRLMHRLQKFFLKDRKINIKNGYFCKRRQPSYKSYQRVPKQIKLLDNQIIIFGIDFIKIRQIVKAYLPEEFKPIDMSHIKLIYRNFDDAMAALRKNMRQDIIENETKLEPNQISPPKGWTQMRPYYINSYERRVLARFATQEEKDVKKSQQLNTHVPEYANRVYNLKKKHSKDIEQNYRIREELIRLKKMQNRPKKFQNKYEQSNQNEDNFDRRNNIENRDDQMSQRSYTLRIGGKRSQKEKEKSNHERSREKDFDDNHSVVSKSSNGSRLAGQFANNMNLDEHTESESVLSDVSFILDQEQNKELFEDMAIRLGLINIDQQNRSMQEDSMSISSSNRNDSSFSSRGSSSTAFRRLTGNIPDQPNQSLTEYSFTKKKWKYNEYNEQRQAEDERKREEQRNHPTIELIQISDDEDQ